MSARALPSAAFRAKVAIEGPSQKVAIEGRVRTGSWTGFLDRPLLGGAAL
jgi:hypothetical protein